LTSGNAAYGQYAKMPADPAQLSTFHLPLSPFCHSSVVGPTAFAVGIVANKQTNEQTNKQSNKERRQETGLGIGRARDPDINK